MCDKLQLFGLIALTMLCFGCARSPTEPDEDVSESVSKRAATIDPIQFQRLGIVTVPVAKEMVSESRSTVGWLEAPSTSRQIVRAPVTGVVASLPDHAYPELGQSVERNQSIANVKIFLTPQEISQLVIAKEDTDIQMQQALVTIQLYETQLNQAITAGDAVTGVRINQLKEAVAHAKTAYKEAQQKLQFLISEPATDGQLVKPVPVETSIRGKVVHVHVTAGQFVIAGDPLITIDNWEHLWLRVPIFESDLGLIDPSSVATYRHPVIGDDHPAHPLIAPTVTKSATRTVDFLYKIENGNWLLRVGQSISISIPIGNQHQGLIIPRSAVLYNTFGQPSCFVLTNKGHSYTRRFIELGSRKGETVEVIHGLSEHDHVVSVGAEQLLADATKAELSVEDDD